MRLSQHTLSLFVGLGVFSAAAVPTDAVQARLAAQGWVSRGTLLDVRLGGGLAESVATHTTTNGAVFHAVKMFAGGTVFLSGDTDAEPVIAFTSATNDYSTIDRASPLWALLSRDAAGRVASRVQAAAPVTRAAWHTLTEQGARVSSGLRLKMAGRSSLGDVRVPKLVQSTWGQDVVGNLAVYNYYTPTYVTKGSFNSMSAVVKEGCVTNAVCGCVATALAQVMRYHQYPTASVKSRSHAFCMFGSTQLTLTTKGGTYDWANMPPNPTSSISDTCRKAIGKLTSDVGIAVEMQYTTGSSGTYNAFVPGACMTDFGYAQAHWLAADDESFKPDAYRRTILSNLDAGFPVVLGISGTAGGHSIVADGYGYQQDTLYVHLNMGWNGGDDLWYALPDIGTWAGFKIVDEVVYNIMPRETGAVISGRILDESGAPVASAEVVARNAAGKAVASTQSNGNGIYAFVLPAATYAIEAQQPGISQKSCVSAPLAAPVETTYVYSSRPRKNYTKVNSEATTGNSWGNDIVLAADVVTLTIACDGPRDLEFAAMPVCGTHTFPVGTNLLLSADAFAAVTNAFGVADSRYPCLGWISGDGSIPPSGTTNVISVVLTNDSTLVWRYAKSPDAYRLRIFESLGDYWLYDAQDGGFYSLFLVFDDWCPVGERLTWKMPEEAVDGDFFTWQGYYYPSSEAQECLWGELTFRLGGFELSRPGEEGALSFDAARHYAMPRQVDFTLTQGQDVCYYYVVTNLMHSAAIPTWWYMRYLQGPLAAGVLTAAEAADAADPDGDGFDNATECREDTEPLDDASFPFRIGGFSLTNLTFSGSVKGTLIVEKCTALGGKWIGVWTNATERASTSNRVDIMKSDASDGFYRVRHIP